MELVKNGYIAFSVFSSLKSVIHKMITVLIKI